jgi:penicillin-binding protein 2
MLNTDRSRLEAACKAGSWRPYIPTPIYLGATPEQATRIAEAGAALPGIDVERQAIRYYPDTVSFSHVLGYVWTPDDRDIDRLRKMELNPPEYVGKNGLEYFYEKELMGTEGAERVEVDAKRRPVRVIGRDTAVPGDRLILSLDANLQKKAISLMKGRKGAIVMLDPSNGEILCLVSMPSFDAALFEGGISSADYRHLSEDKSKPLWNRAIHGYYSPGSTFKLVTSLAAEKAGLFNPYRTVYCAGYYQVGNRRMKCLGHHGAISFQRAMQKSCNTYFGALADNVGPDILREQAFNVGLGRVTGLDIRGEGGGLVPTEKWLEANRVSAKWYRGDTVNMGIGQGYLQVTPLQMACVAALVGNNGISYKPHLLRALIQSGPDGKRIDTERAIFHEAQASDAFWAEMKAALVSVIEGGTAGRARIPGLRWAGKTGTTQHHRGKKDHAWFIGFAPADQPKVAISVIIEEAGHGGTFCAPIARQLVKYYMDSLSKSAKPANPASNSARVAPTVSASARRPESR